MNRPKRAENVMKIVVRNNFDNLIGVGSFFMGCAMSSSVSMVIFCSKFLWFMGYLWSAYLVITKKVRILGEGC